MRVLKILGGFVGFLILIVVGSVLGGYVLSVLWRWFVSSTFCVPNISIVEAIGITLIINFFIRPAEHYKNEEATSGIYGFLKAAILVMLYPLFALFIGWIIHLFM